MEQQGRACRVHLADGLDMNICYIFAHAAHGEELHKSLADAAFLIRTRPRNSNIVLLGDLNIDHLPIFANDPFSDELDRTNKHKDERMAFAQLCAACGVTVHDPTTILGNPGGPFAEHCLSAPITHIPVGDQHDYRRG